MTLPKHTRLWFRRLGRALARTVRTTHLRRINLTIAIPPFLKIEVATETDLPPVPRRHPHVRRHA